MSLKMYNEKLLNTILDICKIRLELVNKFLNDKEGDRIKIIIEENLNFFEHTHQVIKLIDNIVSEFLDENSHNFNPNSIHKYLQIDNKKSKIRNKLLNVSILKKEFPMENEYKLTSKIQDKLIDSLLEHEEVKHKELKKTLK